MTPIDLIRQFGEIARKVDVLWHWKQGLKVTGAKSFVNSDAGASIVIGGQQAAPPSQRPPVAIILARLTSSGLSGAHDFTQQEWTGTGDNLADVTGGISDTAYTVGGTDLTSGTKVVIAKLPSSNGSAYWIIGAIGGSEPSPTAQYQVKQCTAFTDASHFTVDYDFDRGSDT